jgi:hypothetical protein
MSFYHSRSQSRNATSSQSSNSSSPESSASHESRTNRLNKALHNAFEYFQSGSPIPPPLMSKLDSFVVDSETFLRMTRVKELNSGRYIFLEDGKIKFYTYTQPPHAEIIGRVLRQISRQDVADLFIDGSGGGIFFSTFLLNLSRRTTW